MQHFFVRAVGFYNDAYDLFIMTLINLFFHHLYSSSYSPGIQSLVASSVFVGAILGQLGFGFLADGSMGRQKLMVFSASALVIGQICCTFCPVQSDHGFLLLAAFRVLLGIGIGAEYPLSSTFTAEGSETAKRAGAVATTFSMQGLGQLSAAVIGFILVQIFTPTTTSGDLKAKHLEISWRLLFGIGALPSLLILYPRWKSQENTHFHTNRVLIPYHNSSCQKLCFLWKYYGTRLIGTAGCWFLFDIVFYSQSIFAANVLKSKDFGDISLESTTLKLVILASIALPGYFVAILTIDKIGRKNMQLQGFFFMTVIFSVLGYYYHDLKHNVVLFMSLYALTFFFSNFGPNTTTFVLPVETFPTSIRASCHGISAAFGKIGAALGTACFPFVQSRHGNESIFIICAILCLISIGITLLFVCDRPGNLVLLEDELELYIREETSTNPKLKVTNSVNDTGNVASL